MTSLNPRSRPALAMLRVVLQRRHLPVEQDHPDWVRTHPSEPLGLLRWTNAHGQFVELCATTGKGARGLACQWRAYAPRDHGVLRISSHDRVEDALEQLDEIFRRVSASRHAPARP